MLSASIRLCDPRGCNLPGSSIHGNCQAGILGWIAIFYSRGSSQPKYWTCFFWVTCINKWILYHYVTWEAITSWNTASSVMRYNSFTQKTLIKHLPITLWASQVVLEKWTEEPGGLWAVGSQRVKHDWSGLAGMHATIR